MVFRPSERLLFLYFIYTTALSCILPLSLTVRLRLILVSATLAATFSLLAWTDRIRGFEWASITRDWLMAAMPLMCYREIGWLALPHTSTVLEESWIVWDRYLLDGLRWRAMVESLGPVIPIVLEISYLLVYPIGPFCLAVLYILRRRERVGEFQFVYLMGLVLSYILFPFFPSEPPRTVFPGDDLPAYDAVIRKLNLFLVGNYGIHTGVFPSAHVSSAFSAAIAMWHVLPEKRGVAVGLVVLSTLIAAATIYGRYHYAVDALAGLGVAGLVLVITLWRRKTLFIG